MYLSTRKKALNTPLTVAPTNSACQQRSCRPSSCCCHPTEPHASWTMMGADADATLTMPPLPTRLPTLHSARVA